MDKDWHIVVPTVATDILLAPAPVRTLAEQVGEIFNILCHADGVLDVLLDTGSDEAIMDDVTPTLTNGLRNIERLAGEMLNRLEALKSIVGRVK